MYFWIFTFFIMAQYIVKLVCFRIFLILNTRIYCIDYRASWEAKGQVEIMPSLTPGQVLSKIVCQPVQVPHTLCWVFFSSIEWNEHTKGDELELFWTIKKPRCQFTQKTRASVCKTLYPQHLLAPKYGLHSAVFPQKNLDFAQKNW